MEHVQERRTLIESRSFYIVAEVGWYRELTRPYNHGGGFFVFIKLTICCIVKDSTKWKWKET
jgi:hypothetical protein